MATQPLGRRIRDIVATWDGVRVHPHRFGGVEFRVQQREFGHLHGNHLAELPFPVRMRRDLVAAGRAHPHRLLPESGWVSHPIRSEHDVPSVIALLRLNYERLCGTSPRATDARRLPRRALGATMQLLRDPDVDDLPT